MIESNSDDFFSEIIREIKTGKIHSKEELQSEKMKLSKKYSLTSIPGDSEILNLGYFDPEEKKILRIKRTRTISGVAVVDYQDWVPWECTAVSHHWNQKAEFCGRLYFQSTL